MIQWTDAPNGSAGHADGSLVVQIRRLGAGGWSASWCNGQLWDVSDQSTHVSEQSARHFKTRETAKRAVESRMAARERD
jgi:hypothetical protein